MGIDELNIILTLIFIILVVVIISLIANRKNKESSKYNKLLEENRRLNEQFYPNRNYQCKGMNYYTMDDKTKIMYIYGILPTDMKSKLVHYAEVLERDSKARNL